MIGPFLRRLAPLTGALAGVYAVVARPRLLRWGATADERGRDLPGDALIPAPNYATTRAITIAAPPRAIWPWLVQMGQDRAGFYTHNWVERLLRAGIPDTREVHPEWQSLQIGDVMRTNRELQPGHPLGWPVALVEPERALVVTSRSMPSGSYAFVLEPAGAGTTRLVCRDRAVWRWWERPFLYLLYEPLHGYMQTGLLQGLKERAERAVATASAG